MRHDAWMRSLFIAVQKNDLPAVFADLGIRPGANRSDVRNAIQVIQEAGGDKGKAIDLVGKTPLALSGSIENVAKLVTAVTLLLAAGKEALKGLMDLLS